MARVVLETDTSGKLKFDDYKYKVRVDGGSTEIPGDKPGHGVRAEQVRNESNAHILRLMGWNGGFTEDQIERIKAYRHVVELAHFDADPADISDEIERIYAEFAKDLEMGGFLSSECLGGIDSQWEATIASL